MLKFVKVCPECQDIEVTRFMGMFSRGCSNKDCVKYFDRKVYCEDCSYKFDDPQNGSIDLCKVSVSTKIKDDYFSNKHKIESTDALINTSALIKDEYLLVQKGKKNYYIIKVS